MLPTPNIIHSSQTGFMKGRIISENTLKLINLTDHCKKHNIAALLLSVDFEKAFDSIEWDASRLVMQKFNFGLVFIDAVMALYNDKCSTVMNNGHWTEWFPLTCSACQCYKPRILDFRSCDCNKIIKLMFKLLILCLFFLKPN